MKTFHIKIEGTTALLQHRMTEENILALLGSKGVKKAPKVVLTPREIADQHAYKMPGGFCLPTVYFRGTFASVASDYKQKNSNFRTVKSIAGGVFCPIPEFAPLLDKKNKPITTFEVDIRKATNHRAGAVAVCRPRFDEWRTEFDVQVDDTVIDPSLVLQILEDAGRRSGVGSFRVSKGGYFGKFQINAWTEL